MSNFVPQCCTNLESLFSDSIENYDLPAGLGCQTREALKGEVNLTYQMADWLGDRGIKELDCVLSEYANWVSLQENEMPDDGVSVETNDMSTSCCKKICPNDKRWLHR